MENNPKPTDQEPTIEEIGLAVSVLKRLQPGLLPKELFIEIARIWTTSIIEVVPVRKNGEKTEILLLKREADDPNWPGMLHTPGTVVRPTDSEKGIVGPLERIYSDELGLEEWKDPVFVGPILHSVNRGTEMSNVFYLDMTGLQITSGEWYDVENLPENIVDTQKSFIAESIDKYTKDTN
jgi:hypothetical protein